MKLSRLLAAGKSLIGVENKQSPYRMRTPNFLPKFDSPKNPFNQTTKSAGAETPPVVRPAAPVAAVPEPSVTKPTIPAIMETRSLFGEAVKAAATPIRVTETAPEPATPVPIRIEPKIALTPVVDIVNELPPAPAKPAPKPASKRPSSRPLPPTSPLAPPALTLPPVKRSNPPGKPKAFAEFMKKVNPLAHLPSLGMSGGSAKSRPAHVPVQGELSLDKVKVVRNDLSDSDLEVVTAKAAVKIEVSQNETQPERTMQVTGLSRLTARFFSQSHTTPATPAQ
jgi:hypothetical protein